MPLSPILGRSVWDWPPCPPIQWDGVQAGKALGKALPCSGDYSITAVVNTGSDSAASKLFSTSLHTVIRLAESIAEALFESIKVYA